MKITTIYSVLIILMSACGQVDGNSNKEKTNEKSNINDKNIRVESYVWKHDFNTKTGDYLGSFYVKPLNDSIFTSARIINKSDTIYKIDYFDFWNINGSDFNIPKDTTGFYGYKIRLLGTSHAVIGYYSNGGKNVADDFTLSWNKNDKVFKVPIAP